MDMKDKDNFMVDAMPVVNNHDDLLRDGSKDSKGRIARRGSTGGWRTAPLLFGPEVCEKMGVVGIVVNIVPYLTGSFHLSSSYSANFVTTYQGTSYILTLLGGFIADALVGRFWIVVTAGSIQFLGLLLLTLSASVPTFKPRYCGNSLTYSCPVQTGTPLIVIFVSVYLIAIGTGGIKACASAFGADQFDPNHHMEKVNLAGFFSWYFFGISGGAFIGVTFLVWIQDNEGRGWGYLIPTFTMLCVVTAFVYGRSRYRYKNPTGSPLTQILQVFVAAYKNRKLPLPSATESLFEFDKTNQPFDYMRVKRSSQFKFLDKAAIFVDGSSKLGDTTLWRLNTVTRVEETKMVIRLLPILLTTSLFYTVYAQTSTFSVQQGISMQRKLGKFEIPAGSMGVFLQIAILSSLYVWEKVVVPIARSFNGKDKGTTSLQRIGIGLFISICAMVVSAVVEKKRIHYVHAEDLGARQKVDPKAHVSMSIFWLIPQYMLVGAGEAFTYTGQLDFFYNESPRGMRSMGSALCICTLSLGYYTSSLLVSLVKSTTGHRLSDGSIIGNWLPDSVGTGGRLDKFFGLLAVISLANLLTFMACARWYQYKSVASTEDVSISDPSALLEEITLDKIGTHEIGTLPMMMKNPNPDDSHQPNNYS